MEWNIADAQDRFDELVALALTEGPQRIHRQNEDVVVISSSEYNRLISQHPSFKAFLLEGPSFEGLDLGRDRSPGRDVAL